ncbi:MAG: FtsW/RodA/SpoVE family cell cycle protein [bacterium]|nr:FtsW/RodA/SpoVE family cell cycle protein [bacterium]
MRGIFLHIKRLDQILTAAAFALTGIGLLSIYSSSLRSHDFSNLEKQAGFLLVGLLLMLILSAIDWRLLKGDSFLILLAYALGVMALVGLLFFAPEIRGIKRWYRVGGFLIDPIEYMKIIILILMAKYFAWRHAEIFRIRHILVSGLYFALPIGLIFLQPELGSVLILGLVWVVMLLVAGIRPKHLLVLIAIGIMVFSLSWTLVLKDYQKNRLLTFVEPELDPLGLGWSQLQSKIAIGNGGLVGRGIGNGTQTQYGFLSEPQTDFMFAAIAEETGFMGILVLFGLFFVLISRIIKIGLEASANFPRIFAAGMATVLGVGVFINVGMNLGFLPIVGLPLPLVSYGGSGLLMTFIGLGVLQSIRAH